MRSENGILRYISITGRDGRRRNQLDSKAYINNVDLAILAISQNFAALLGSSEVICQIPQLLGMVTGIASVQERLEACACIVRSYPSSCPTLSDFSIQKTFRKPERKRRAENSWLLNL